VAEAARARRELDQATRAEADSDRALAAHEAKLSEVRALLEPPVHNSAGTSRTRTGGRTASAGSDPQGPGARRWAASAPNLLNVAVSRAKRRLYVIGNRQLWADQRYFKVMARTL
jgi:hypothetical protein